MDEKKLSITDYFLLYERLNRQPKKRQFKERRHIKVAILASSTIKGIPEVLTVKCAESGIGAKVYVPEYNQYRQEIIDIKSGFYRFKPDITVLFIDTKSLLGDYFYFPYRYSEQKRRNFINKRIDNLIVLIKKFISDSLSKSKLIVHNFEVPIYSPYGILELKQKFGYIESVRYMNKKLQDYFYKNSEVFIFDYDSFLNKIGKSNALDRKMYYLADMKLNHNFIPALCDEYMRFIKIVKAMSRKCIILDLDNTLWGGVLGEDGFAGIKLGTTAPGNAYVEFQKYLLSLSERGIILAINSNNNYKEAIDVIRKHPNMVLRQDNFACIKINWENKASNILEIAKELNLGLDSLIYIEDSKQNRQLIRQMLPEVFVLEMPDDVSDYVKAIEELKELDWFNITVEDKLRGMIYSQERSRREFRENFKNIDKYLNSLQTKLSIKETDKFSIPRIAQLTQRTNQFNLTTHRYSEQEILNFSKNSKYHVYYVSVSDRFGDSGISGAVILKKDKENFLIDTFLLSCRVLGRGIEKAVLAFILKQGKKGGFKFSWGQYIPTQKNELVNDFYKNNGFTLKQSNKNGQIWSFDLKNKVEYPKFTRLVK